MWSVSGAVAPALTRRYAPRFSAPPPPPRRGEGTGAPCLTSLAPWERETRVSARVRVVATARVRVPQLMWSVSGAVAPALTRRYAPRFSAPPPPPRRGERMKAPAFPSLAPWERETRASARVRVAPLPSSLAPWERETRFTARVRVFPRVRVAHCLAPSPPGRGKRAPARG